MESMARKKGEVEKPEGKPTMKDFFVSYTIADESAVKWVAYELEHAGYSTYPMKWDQTQIATLC